jgi:hypothetical protein
MPLSGKRFVDLIAPFVLDRRRCNIIGMRGGAGG